MTGSGQIVEVQGTAEEKAFSKKQLNDMLDVGWKGLEEIFALQRETLKQCGVVWK